MANKVISASDMRDKQDSRIKCYTRLVDEIINEQAQEYIRKEKECALKASKEYQELKARLNALKVSILEPVVNKAYAHKLAIRFGKLWGMDADKLENLIVDENGRVYRDGKPYAIATNNNAGSYMAYLYKALTKTAVKLADENEDIYNEVCGGLVWVDDITTVANKVAKRRNIEIKDVLAAYNKVKATKEQA